MKTPAKERVITKFQANRKRSLEFLSSFDAGTWETYRQGEWGLREVVAHIIGWTYESARALGELANGLPPSYDAHDKDDDWAEINTIFIHKYGDGSPTLLVDRLRASGEYMVSEAGKLSATTFEASNGVFRKNRQWTVYVELDDTADHERRHLDRIIAELGHSKP